MRPFNFRRVPRIELIRRAHFLRILAAVDDLDDRLELEQAAKEMVAATAGRAAYVRRPSLWPR